MEDNSPFVVFEEDNTLLPEGVAQAETTKKQSYYSSKSKEQ